MSNLYADIARRTGGDIYIGVVGPVRTGKSTLIKRIMEELVIPNIEDLYQRERARDELPQSGSGRTIMTAEPKFVPEEAVEITPDGTARLSVRLIDSVGYLVDGAIGATENGQPRMVTTPWAETELSMEEAAELGTRKVMEEHSTVGLVVTTDGSITDIPRADYREAEARAIRDMQATGKPFLVVVNSAAPNGGQAQALRCELEETYGVHAVTADCQSLHEAELGELLRASAPSIHMLRADIQTEISPMVGNEQQSEDLVQYLLGGYESDPEKLWESNIFGRSVFELVNEGLNTKLKRMPEDARYKLKDALTKIINEGANGLICLMF